MSGKWSFILVGLLVSVSLGCGDQPIVHDLAEEDANRLVDRLNTDSIEATKVDQGNGKWRLEVPATEAIEAISTVQRERLLEGVNRETPESPSLLAPRESQMFAHERALSITLEKTLLSINGIYDARIHLNIVAHHEAKSLFTKMRSQDGIENSHSSAAVLLVVDGKVEGVEQSVQRLVSGATGIPSERVSVILSHALKPKRGPSTNGKAHLASSTAEPSAAEVLMANKVVQVVVAIVLAMTAFWVAMKRRRRRSGVRERSLSSNAWASYQQ
jgi:type III secretory pathway lipoprotein EscJ